MAKKNVLRKQQNSKMCLVCGLSNRFGLKAAFYELEDAQIVAIFRPMEERQGYPGRLHGGIATAILDETVGRAIMTRNEDEIWGLTVDFNITFRKPIPLDEELEVIGRITEENARFFNGTGEILLANREVAATGKGRYIKLPIEKIADFDRVENDWMVVPSENDPDDFEVS